MKKTSFIKALSVALCVVLIAVMALFAAGCNDDVNLKVGTQTNVAETKEMPEKNDAPSEDSAGKAPEGTTAVTGTLLGEGERRFFFKVTDVEGVVWDFEIHTDKKTVGEALMELNLIDGEEGAYGLYVKTVNGTTLDYDTDKMYWAFYENGDYAMSGVDSTEITDGKVYEFKAEK